MHAFRKHRQEEERKQCLEGLHASAVYTEPKREGPGAAVLHSIRSSAGQRTKVWNLTDNKH